MRKLGTFLVVYRWRVVGSDTDLAENGPKMGSYEHGNAFPRLSQNSPKWALNRPFSVLRRVMPIVYFPRELRTWIAVTVLVLVVLVIPGKESHVVGEM